MRNGMKQEFKNGKKSEERIKETDEERGRLSEYIRNCLETQEDREFILQIPFKERAIGK